MHNTQYSAVLNYVRFAEDVIRALGRTVLKVKKFDRIKRDITTRLDWLLPKYKYQLQILKFVNLNLQGICPDVMLNYFDSQINDYVQRVTRRGIIKLVGGNSHCNCSVKSISYEGARLWLRRNLISEKNCVFARKLKSLLIQEQFDDCYDNSSFREDGCDCVMCN